MSRLCDRLSLCCFLWMVWGPVYPEWPSPHILPPLQPLCLSALFHVCCSFSGGQCASNTRAETSENLLLDLNFHRSENQRNTVIIWRHFVSNTINSQAANTGKLHWYEHVMYRNIRRIFKKSFCLQNIPRCAARNTTGTLPRRRACSHVELNANADMSTATYPHTAVRRISYEKLRTFLCA